MYLWLIHSAIQYVFPAFDCAQQESIVIIIIR